VVLRDHIERRSTIVAALLLIALRGCGGDPYCDGARCACGNQELCAIQCSEPHGCDVACGQGTTCDVSCGDDCSVTCQSSSQCHADMGAGARFTCQDVSDCVATLGDRATAVCERIGGCHVRCLGACRVDCTQGSCDILCADGKQAASCPAAPMSGEFVCGAGC
jgi:hypothetical protein